MSQPHRFSLAESDASTASLGLSRPAAIDDGADDRDTPQADFSRVSPAAKRASMVVAPLLETALAATEQSDLDSLIVASPAIGSDERGDAVRSDVTPVHGANTSLHPLALSLLSATSAETPNALASSAPQALPHSIPAASFPLADPKGVLATFQIDFDVGTSIQAFAERVRQSTMRDGPPIAGHAARVDASLAPTEAEWCADTIARMSDAHDWFLCESQFMSKPDVVVAPASSVPYKPDDPSESVAPAAPPSVPAAPPAAPEVMVLRPVRLFGVRFAQLICNAGSQALERNGEKRPQNWKMVSGRDHGQTGSNQER